MNDHPKPQETQTYREEWKKWVIQCPPIDPRISLTQKNKRKVVFFVGVRSIIAIYSHLYGKRAIWGHLHFFSFILGSIVLKKKWKELA